MQCERSRSINNHFFRGLFLLLLSLLKFVRSEKHTEFEKNITHGLVIYLVRNHEEDFSSSNCSSQKVRTLVTAKTRILDLSLFLKSLSTGKSLSEALIFASTNPQYDDRFFIELQVQYMKIPSSNLGRKQKLFLTFRTIFVHNMF